MAKRGQGEGSISRRSDGTWWARITIGKDENGKQQRKAYYGRTRKEVQDKMASALNGGDLSLSVVSAKMTLRQWGLRWLQDYKQLAVRSSTYERALSDMEAHIFKHIGDYQLCELQADMVQKIITKMNQDGYAPETIRKPIGQLRSCLEQAVKNGILRKNVAKDTVLPQKKYKEKEVLSREEQIKFVKIAKTMKHGQLFILILATGLRIGEALALTWNDIDLDRDLLSVNKTVAKRKGREGEKNKHMLIINPPKTKTSNRTIPLLPAIAEMLRTMRCGRSSQDLVFPAQNGGGLMQPSVARSHLLVILKAANIKSDLTLHSLRHTFATRGLENGIPLKVMQELLGHTSIKMTADLYTHVLPDTKRDALALMESATTRLEAV